MTPKPISKSQRYFLDHARGLPPTEGIDTHDWHVQKVQEEVLNGEAGHIHSDLFLESLNSALARGYGASIIMAMALAQEKYDILFEEIQSKYPGNIKAQRKEFVARTRDIAKSTARKIFVKVYERLRGGNQ